MRKNIRGGIPIAYLLIILGTGVAGWFAAKKLTTSDSAAKPTAVGSAVISNLNAQEKTNKQIDEDKDRQAKIGQQYVEAQGLALQYVKSDEPALQLIKNLNPRASLALNNGLGPLDVDQQRWATELVLNSLSEEVKKRALAEQSLSIKDKELQGSITEVKTLGIRIDSLQEANQTLTNKLVQEDAAAVNFRSKIYWGIGLFLFVVIGLPILSSAFPILAGLTNGLGAIISPFLHKAKKEAEGLAHDAVGIVHELETKASEVGTIAKTDFDKIKTAWISEAHKNVHQYDEVKRKLNLI